MISFRTDEGRFNYRVVAVALHREHVLVQRAVHDDFWALPGGRCELLEPAATTIKREMREELRVDADAQRLLWIVENFFTFEGVPFHEIAFYFLTSFAPDAYLYHSDGPFDGIEDGEIPLIFKWHALDDLDNIALYPTFLRQGLKSIPEHTTHVVHRDEE